MTVYDLSLLWFTFQSTSNNSLSLHSTGRMCVYEVMLLVRHRSISRLNKACFALCDSITLMLLSCFLFTTPFCYSKHWGLATRLGGL